MSASEQSLRSALPNSSSAPGDLKVRGCLQLDDAVLAALPAGDKVTRVESYGLSSWASTARVFIERGDGTNCSYFLKLMKTTDAAQRVLGESMAMLEIYQTLPSFVPQPRGYGMCSDQITWFYFCDFLHIKPDRMPDPVKLGRQLAELHRTSKSPTGMFGFHVTTFDGKLPLNTTWESSWSTFFTSMMRDVYKLDAQTNGTWDDLEELMDVALTKLIPRLLDPLTANGRTIKPSLIHGDLWEANIGTNKDTGDIFIFDACAYYAHHEKELGIWRCDHHQIGDHKYRQEYLRHNPPSEPQEEFESRLDLYAVETLLIHSAHFPGADTRQKALDLLKSLIAKYVGGNE